MKRSLAMTGLGLVLGASALAGAQAAAINFLDLGNRLVRVDSAAPGTITGTILLTGIQGNEMLLGIDYRPASPRVLYGLSTAGRLYAINPLTGGATAVGNPVLVAGVAAGVDFNPAVDRLRVVTNTNQNLRLNPDTGGLAATDTPVFYAAGDPGAGFAPRVAGAAYTNNTPGTASTTLYVIDTNRGVLATQGSVGGSVSPNTGQLFTVGTLGVATNDNVGFDIVRDGTVLASLTQPGTGTTSLYSVNLTTGAATLIGVVGGVAGKTYLGLAIAPPTIASYGATANQIVIGSALDNFAGVPSAGLNSLFISLDGLAVADRAGALSQLTPAAYGLLPELTLRTAEFEQDVLQRYLRDFRDHGTGGTAASGGSVGSFLVVTGRDGRYDADVDRPRIGYSGVGIIGGVDYRLNDRFLIGVTGGYDVAKVRLGGNVRNSEIRNYFGGGYATYGIGPAYIDVFGSYGEADYDLRRNVRFGTTPAGGVTTALDFTSTTSSKTYLGGGTIGASLKLGALVLEPFAGVRYARVKIDGFSEGTTIAALTLNRVDYTSVLGNFGAKLGAEFMIGGAKFRPEIRGAYRHEFRDDGKDGYGFGFAGTGNSAALPFTPTALRRSYYTGGAGFTVSGDTSPISLIVDYTGEYAKDRSINGITGGLRLVF